MTDADFLRRSFVSLEVNGTFCEAVLVMSDDSSLCFCHKVGERIAKATGDDKPLSFRFQFRPERKGVNFYRVRAFAASEETKNKAADADADAGAAAAPAPAPAATSEQTLANNSRLVVVDQGSGPYRVLYVGGRPNWEFKYLRRAVADDEQVQLVGLIRIARRQPKFDFRDPRARSNSRLFDGFEHPDAQTAERHDQPVLVRDKDRDVRSMVRSFFEAPGIVYANKALQADPARYCAEVTEAMAAGKAVSMIWETRQGRAISIVNRPIPGSSYWVGTHDDITERRAAERQSTLLGEQQARRRR